ERPVDGVGHGTRDLWHRRLTDRRHTRQRGVRRALPGRGRGPRLGESDTMVEHREPTGGSLMTTRDILVVAHAQRADTVAAAERVITALRDAGARPVLPGDDEALLTELASTGAAVLGTDVDVADIELAIVLGGDGTILRAAEIVRDGSAPVLGINM